MKIAYTISGIYNSGGMENILLQKASYLADIYGYDVTIITTHQMARPPFFYVSKAVHLIDLDINYQRYSKKNILYRQLKKLFLRKTHREKLSHVLFRNKYDIVISLMDYDFTFLYKINDGSKKVLEYHFSKYSKELNACNPVVKRVQHLRANLWEFTVRRYDKFVVLTDEDKRQWGNLPNIVVIPNFISKKPNVISSLANKRVISVGRFEYQKGFDLLLRAWRIVADYYPDWKLSIIGGGDRAAIEKEREKLSLKETVELLPPTDRISEEYLSSSLYVMSSRYEGLPLVLIEAMAYGLPIVSFRCPCGPADILQPTFSSLVDCYDTEKLANEIMSWLSDPDRLTKAGYMAHKSSESYQMPNVMSRWALLFEQI